MKGLVITQVGLESISEKEVLSLLPKAKTTKGHGTVVVEVKELQDLCSIAYRCQSVTKVLLLLNHAKTIKEAQGDLKLQDYVHGTFACRAKSDINSSQELSGAVGAHVKSLTDAKVSLKNPDTTIYALEQAEDAYIGVDLSGTDLTKRDYRVFAGVEQLKATTAFGALLFAGYKSGKTLIDPFCRAGIIPIEAALHSTQRSHLYFAKEKLAFTKMKGDWESFFTKQDEEYDEPEMNITAVDNLARHVTFVKKNAKIAGINKLITYSRMDLDWLETRFDENSVDVIVTKIPEPGKKMTEKKCEKIYQEFFYQCEYILKKDGNVTVIIRDPTLLLQVAEQKGFKEQDRLQVEQGLETYFYLKLSKN